MQFNVGDAVFLKRCYIANVVEEDNPNVALITRGTIVFIRAITPTLSLLGDKKTLVTVETVDEYANGKKESVYFVADVVDLATTLEENSDENHT